MHTGVCIESGSERFVRGFFFRLHRIELTMLALELVSLAKAKDQCTYGTPYPMIVEGQNFVLIYLLIWGGKSLQTWQPGN